MCHLCSVGVKKGVISVPLSDIFKGTDLAFDKIASFKVENQALLTTNVSDHNSDIIVVLDDQKKEDIKNRECIEYKRDEIHVQNSIDETKKTDNECSFLDDAGIRKQKLCYPEAMKGKNTVFFCKCLSLKLILSVKVSLKLNLKTPGVKLARIWDRLVSAKVLM